MGFGEFEVDGSMDAASLLKYDLRMNLSSSRKILRRCSNTPFQSGGDYGNDGFLFSFNESIEDLADLYSFVSGEDVKFGISLVL